MKFFKSEREQYYHFMMNLVSKEKIRTLVCQSQRSKAIFEWMQKIKEKHDDYVKTLSNPHSNEEIKLQNIEEEKQVINQLLDQSDHKLWCYTELQRMALLLSWRIFVFSERNNESIRKVSTRQT